MTPMEKRCTRCQQVKPYGQFYRQYTHAAARRAECKDCSKALTRAAYENKKRADG